MNGFGVREIVGVAVLLVGLAIGFMYLNPASGRSTDTAPVTATPMTGLAGDPEATATPAPVTLRPPVNGWIIGYYEDAKSGGSILAAQTAANSLDLEYKGAPFPDVKDDAWSVRAEGAWDLKAGTYLLPVEYAGKLTASVNGTSIANEEAKAPGRSTRLRFEHSGGTAVIRLEVHDSGGLLKLKAAE